MGVLEQFVNTTGNYTDAYGEWNFNGTNLVVGKFGQSYSNILY